LGDGKGPVPKEEAAPTEAALLRLVAKTDNEAVTASKLYVVTVNELFGGFQRGVIVEAFKVNCEMAISAGVRYSVPLVETVSQPPRIPAGHMMLGWPHRPPTPFRENPL
jgi:hypothetical protein